MPFALLVEVRHLDDNQTWTWSFPLCLLYSYSDVFLCSASIVHMSVISLDRYLGISKPLKMRNKSRRVVAVKIAVVWLITTVISSPLAVLAVLDHSTILHNNNNVCMINNRYYMIYGSTLSFLIPFFIMALTFLRTRYLLKKQVYALYSPTNTTIATSPVAGSSDNTAADAKNSLTGSLVVVAGTVDDNRLRKTVARRKLGYIRTNSLGRSCFNNNAFESARHKGSTAVQKASVCSRASLLTGTSPTVSERIAADLWNSPTPSVISATKDRIVAEIFSHDLSINNQQVPIVEKLQPPRSCSLIWRRLAYAIFDEKPSFSFSPPIKNHLRTADAPTSSSTSSSSNPRGNHLNNLRCYSTLRRRRPASNLVATALWRSRHAATSFKRRSISIELANEEKATRVLAFVFSCFFVCWTPFFLSNFAYGFCGAGCAPPKWATSLFLWLGYASSTLNPIIYTVFNKRFRQAFWRILQCRCTPSSRRKAHFRWQQQQQATSYVWQHQYSMQSRSAGFGDTSSGRW